jgi:hypothetical protein
MSAVAQTAIGLEANFAPLSDAERSAENATVGGKKERCRGAENVPQSPSKSSFRTPSAESALLATPSGAEAGGGGEQDGDLRPRRGDEQRWENRYEATTNGGSSERAASRDPAHHRKQDHSPRDGSDGKFSAKSAAWEENKVVLEGEELVIRVEGGPWFITKHPPAFRFSQGVLGEEDIEQAMAAAAVMDGLE